MIQTTPPRLSVRDTARLTSDLFCLWRICGKPLCRRAHACRGDTRSGIRKCLRALPLVPPEALLFLKAMDEERGWLSFDELLQKHEEEWQAVEDWRELVMSTLPESDAWREE
jgi:hypothetical protein